LEEEMAGNYARLFNAYTDEQLLELAIQRDTLVDAGKTALDEEMKRRGFDPHEQVTQRAEVATGEPQIKSTSRTLIWFAPTVGFYLLIFILVVTPGATRNNVAFLCLMFTYCFTSPFGSFWMLYQSIRFESKPLKYVILSFLPYAFLWYYFERVRKRTYLGRMPVSLR
jgi:uncharacterized integral membrane protein